MKKPNPILTTIISSFALVLGLCLLPASAVADDNTIYTNITYEQLGQLMLDNGWNVEFPYGDVTWYIDDEYTTLFLYDDGNAIQFYKYITGVPYTLWELNEWNRDHRYSRTYLDGDGDPVLELDLDLTGGVTEARIVDWLKTCHVSLLDWYWTITGKD